MQLNSTSIPLSVPNTSPINVGFNIPASLAGATITRGRIWGTFQPNNGTVMFQTTHASSTGSISGNWFDVELSRFSFQDLVAAASGAFNFSATFPNSGTLLTCNLSLSFYGSVESSLKGWQPIQAAALAAGTYQVNASGTVIQSNLVTGNNYYPDGYNGGASPPLPDLGTNSGYSTYQAAKQPNYPGGQGSNFCPLPFNLILGLSSVVPISGSFPALLTQTSPIWYYKYPGVLTISAVQAGQYLYGIFNDDTTITPLIPSGYYDNFNAYSVNLSSGAPPIPPTTAPPFQNYRRIMLNMR